MIKKSLYRYCISCKCVASSWVLDVIACLSFPHMLALCILKMSKPKHGEDYFQESFHVLPQRSNKSFWNKRRVGQEHYFFIPLFNYVGKSALCFLARCIFISSTCAVHLHPLLKLGFFLIFFFFTFRRGMGRTWQNPDMSFQSICHAGVQKLKMKIFSPV